MNRNTMTRTLFSVLLAALTALTVPAAAQSKAAATSAACSAIAIDHPDQVMVDIRLVQLNEPLLEISLCPSQMIIHHQPSETGQSPPDGAGAEERSAREKSDDSTITIAASSPGEVNDPGITVISITDEATLKLGNSVLRLAKDKFFDAIDETNIYAGKSAAWEVLAAPRIRAKVGQQAGITIGTTVPYMVKREDGSLVVESAAEVNEGLAVKLTIDKAGEGLVSFKDISVEINRIAGRQKIAGVPFDVGRPIIQSMKVSSSMVLGADHVAIITLPRVTEDNPPIFIFLRAHHINQP